MKHFLILLTLLVSIGTTFAQKPWKWTQLKGPNVGSTNFTMMFDENNDIIAVGPLGYFLSPNNGATWDYHSIIVQKGFDCSSYYSSSPYATTYSGLLIAPSGEYYFYFRSCDPVDSNAVGVYQSLDKGNTWNHILKNYSVFQMVMGKNNSIMLFATVNNLCYLFQSIDKGSSWTQLFQPENYRFQIIGSNDNYLYALFNASSNLSGNLERMSYSNFQWESYIISSSTGSNIYGGFAQLAGNLFIASDGSNVYTFDGENPGNQIGGISGMTAFTKGNGDSLYATRESADYRKLWIDLSTDFGANWQHFADILPYHYGSSPLSLNCQNSNQLLFEDDTALYLSVDKGKSWKEIGLPGDSIYQILVTKDGRIFSQDVPYTPQYYFLARDMHFSEDKGQTWKRSRLGYNQITGIGKGINGTLFAIGVDPSDNKNSIWLFDTTQSRLEKRSVMENVESHPLIVSDDTKYTYIASNSSYLGEPTIYRSDDNGFSWIDMEAPNTSNDIYSLDASIDGTVYFGSYSVIYRSDDHGATWTKLLPVKDIVKFTYIKTFGTNGVLLGTEGDGLLLSNDKGNSWSRIDGRKFDTVTCMSVTSLGEIAAGTDRGLWLSDTSKKIWTKVMLGRGDNIRIGAIDVSNSDDFYIGTYGLSTWIGTRHYNTVNSFPEFTSLMRISPNPASERISVSIDMPNEGKVKLELYDVLGRRMAILADGIYSGENQIHFNSSNLPSGVYTFILSGAENSTQKFVVR